MADDTTSAPDPNTSPWDWARANADALSGSGGTFTNPAPVPPPAPPAPPAATPDWRTATPTASFLKAIIPMLAPASGDPYQQNYTLDPQKGMMPDPHGELTKDDMANGYNRLPLNNGGYFNYDMRVTSPEQALKEQARLNAGMDKTYMGLAAKRPDGTFWTSSNIYSATNKYPNTAIGGQRAAFDASGPGNWINTNIASRTIPGSGLLTDKGVTYGDVGNMLSRAAPYIYAPSTGLADLTATGVNVAKHLVAPNLGTSYDVPTVAGTWREQTGTPDIPQDASFWQRALETLTAGRGRGLVPALTSTYGGDLGGDVGEYFFGPKGREAGSYIGTLVGGAGPTTAKTALTRVYAPSMAKEGDVTNVRRESGQDVYNAGQALAQDYAARTGEPPPNWPSAVSMMEPGWQHIMNWLGATPPWGNRLEADKTDHARAIFQAQDASTQAISPGFRPGTGSVENAGRLLYQGSRDVIPRLLQEREQPYLDIASRYGIQPTDEVDITPFLSSIDHATGGNLRQGPTEDAIRQIANNSVVESSQYGHRFNQPGRPNADVTSPNAAPTVPYGLLQDVLSGASNMLPNGQMTTESAVPLAIKNAALAAMEAHLAARGAPPDALSAARANFAHYSEHILPDYFKVAGEPRRVTDPATGQVNYEFPPQSMGDGDIANSVLFSNKQNSGVYDNFSRRLDPAVRAAVAANAIDMLGRTRGQLAGGSERPEAFANDYASYGDLMHVLTGTEPPPPPGVLSSSERLAHAATLGRNFDLKPAATGLRRTAGVAIGMRDLAHAVFGHLPFGLGPAAQAGFTRFTAGDVTSPETKRAIAQAPMGDQLSNALYGNVPQMATAADQQAEKRKSFYDTMMSRILQSRTPQP